MILRSGHGDEVFFAAGHSGEEPKVAASSSGSRKSKTILLTVPSFMVETMGLPPSDQALLSKLPSGKY